MECPKCKTSNPETNKFCGQCGAPFDPSSCAIDDYVCRQIESTLESKIKDRNLVEIEITEIISKKLIDWARIFAFFVGIPLALFSIIVIFIGINSYRQIENAKDNVIKNASHANEVLKRAIELEPRVTYATKQLIELDRRMSHMEKIQFDKTVKIELIAKLKKFENYLKDLGFNPSEYIVRTLQIIIDKEHKENTRYDQKENIIYVGDSIQDDEDLIYREYAMYILRTSLAEIHDLNKESFDDNYMTIESGLEDYFTCSYTGNPKLGVNTAQFRQERHGKLRFPEDCLRDLNNDNKFGNLRNVDAYQFGGIWGAAFWEMRKLYGQEKSDKLLFAAWNEFIKVVNKPEKYSPEKCFSIFVEIIIDKDNKLNEGKYNAKIKEIFAKRGL